MRIRHLLLHSSSCYVKTNKITLGWMYPLNSFSQEHQEQENQQLHRSWQENLDLFIMRRIVLLISRTRIYLWIPKTHQWLKMTKRNWRTEMEKGFLWQDISTTMELNKICQLALFLVPQLLNLPFFSILTSGSWSGGAKRNKSGRNESL